MGMRLVRAQLVRGQGREQCEVCGNAVAGSPGEWALREAHSLVDDGAGPEDVRELLRGGALDAVYLFVDSRGAQVRCCHECRGRCLAAESAEEFSEYRRTQ